MAPRFAASGFACAGAALCGCATAVPVALAGFAGAILKDSNFNGVHPRLALCFTVGYGAASAHTRRETGRLGRQSAREIYGASV